MTDVAIPMELIEQISRGNVVFLVGPGVSIGSGLPSPSRLVGELAERLGMSPEGWDLAKLAQYYENRFGRHGLIEYLRDRLDSTRIQPTPAHALLAELPVRYIVTTNYDDLIEYALRRAGRSFNRVVNDADAAYVTPDRVQLVKLYGSIDQPDTVALTSRDLEVLCSLELPALRDMLRSLFATKSWVFLGYSLSGPDLRLFLELFVLEFGPYVIRSYVVTTDADPADVEWLTRYNITVIRADTEEFLASLKRQLGVFGPEPRIRSELMAFEQGAISNYLSFNLQLFGQPGSHSVILHESPAGEARAHFELPTPRSLLENMLDRVRRHQSDEGILQKIGGYLFSVLFKGPIKSAFDRSLALLSSEQGLRINLRIDSPELASLPWELMYDPERNQFLSLSLRTPLARYFAVRKRLKELEVTLPLRVLVVAPSPVNLPSLGIEREQKVLREALDPLIRQGSVEVNFLEKPTIAKLQEKLRREQFHILHFAGHGYFENQDSYLAFEDEHGHTVGASADRLSYLLEDSGIRLVVINACETARAPGDESLVGIGAAIVRGGVPASLDMQFPITDDSAIAFSRGFYSAIADGLPVDASVQEARKSLALASGLGSPAWASPVLFSQVRDEVIFTIRKQSKLSALAVNFFKKAGFEGRILSTAAEGIVTDLLLEPQRLRYSKYGTVLARCVDKLEIEVDDIVRLRNDALPYYQQLDPAKGLRGKLTFMVSSSRPNRAVLLPLYSYKEQDDFMIVPLEAGVIRSALLKKDVDAELDFIVGQYTGHVNLYEIRLPITDPMWLFGRDSKISEILEYVRQSQHVGIFGMRKIGKTSLIRQITYKLTDDLFCYIDMQGVSKDSRYLYQDIIHRLADDLRRHTDQKPPLTLLGWDSSSELDVVHAFKQDMEAICETMRQVSLDFRVVIIFDEIDIILPPKTTKKSGIIAALRKLLRLTRKPAKTDGRTDFVGFEELLAVLRAIAQEGNQLVLIATSLDAEINRVDRWHLGTGHDNPMRASFVEIFLPPLGKEDCWQMIESIGLLMGVKYTKPALRAIYESTSGHPLITRLLCSSIVNKQPRKIKLSDVQTGVERFLNDPSKTNYFQVMWKKFKVGWGNEAKWVRRILIGMALGQPISQIAESLSLSREKFNAMLGYLREQHLVRGTGEDSYIPMSLLVEWIKRNKASAN